MTASSCRRRLPASWLIAVGILSLSALGASANEYPSKPIRFIVPFGAGSATDIVIRQIIPGMSAELGQQVFVENKPGGGGNVGAEAAIGSAPDGYTIFMGSTASHAANPNLVKSISYDPFKSLAPVAKMASYSLILVTPSSLPVKSVADLVAYAKSSKGAITFASSGVGSSAHVFGLAFAAATGLELTHVPYSSPSQAFSDLVSGRLTMMFYLYNALQPFVEGGQLRVLASTGANRLSYLPDAPTMVESGYSDFVWTSWIGLFAPANTPEAVIRRLHEAVMKAESDPALIQKLQAGGVEATLSTPAELGAFARSEYERYRKLFKAAGIEPR